MKKIAILGFLMLVFLYSKAQIDVKVREPKYRKHTGFYFSLGLGANFPSISSEVEDIYNMTLTGAGAQFDLKIGGAVGENLILHANLTYNIMNASEITMYGSSPNYSNNLTAAESVVGAGMTYYIMPSNFFVSASIGSGNFTIVDNDTENKVSSDRGFSMQFKVGKEWWITKRWGLGVAMTYGKTKLTNSLSGLANEKMNSNNVGILFNTTFN